jgi:hypothetical protein
MSMWNDTIYKCSWNIAKVAVKTLNYQLHCNLEGQGHKRNSAVHHNKTDIVYILQKFWFTQDIVFTDRQTTEWTATPFVW